MFNFFKKKAKQSKDMTELQFKITGMHCPSCAVNIDGELEDLSGVFEATTSYRSGVTKVAFDPNQITEQKLVETIEVQGYSAQKA